MPTIKPLRAFKRRRSGFTLVEALVAILFMAIVVPIALSGMRVASMAGEASQRKLAAARIANSVLNNLKVQNELLGGGQRGTVNENGIIYSWSERSTLWSQDTLARMTIATVSVQYYVANKQCSVDLSTLVPQPGI